MIDLRRSIIAVKVKPNDSKADDFHTALSDYLYKELKFQGINVRKHSVNLKVSLSNLHKDKYDHIIIDCLSGKMYLRGKEVRDKFFGKLRRFEGSRPADAYHCVVQSATRIVNRIKKLMDNLLDDNDEREIYAEEDIHIIDMRKKKTTRLIKKTSFLNKIATVPTLRDEYNVEDYDFVDIGIQDVDVSKIVGMCDGRSEEYNSDFTPINEDDPRWIKIYNGYKNNDNIPPIPLILTPDGFYYGNGDGSHRISVVKVLGLTTISANVSKMVSKDQGVDSSWEEYAKDKINKLESMSKKYQSMWSEFYKLQDEAFETGKKDKYNQFKKEMDNLAKEINILDRELRQEENDYKNNMLKQSKLITADAYEWVKERAEHIKDKNPDMDEGETFAISWIQYKKEHPNWKSKKDKSKKGNINFKRLIKKSDDGGGDMGGMSTPSISIDSPNYSPPAGGFPTSEVKYNIIDTPVKEPNYRMWYPTYDYRKKNLKKRIKKKTAAFVYCRCCGFDNGDFMYNDDGTLQGWVPNPDTKKFKRLKENQIYKTEKEFYEKNPDWKCPKCGKKE